MVGGDESLISEDPVRGSPDRTAPLRFDMHLQGTVTEKDVELLGNQVGTLAGTFNAVGSLAIESNVTPNDAQASPTVASEIDIESLLGLSPAESEQLRLQMIEKQRGAFAFAFGLTARQVQAAELIAQGLSNREVGDILGITENTVKTMVSTILIRTGAQNRIEVTLQFNGIPLGPYRSDRAEL